MIVPSGRNAGRSLASVSTVVAGRMPSSCVTVSDAPPRCGTVTPTISSANSPAAAAAAARWWLAAANSSCSARVMPSLLPLFSVDSPMDS